MSVLPFHRCLVAVCIFSMVLVIFVGFFFFLLLSDRLLSVCLPFSLSDNFVFTASMLGAGECRNTFPEPVRVAGGRPWGRGAPAEEESRISCSSSVLDWILSPSQTSGVRC